MAHIRKRGDSWYAEVSLTGHEPQRATRPTKGAAREWADDVERRLRAGTFVTKRPVSDALDKYGLQVSPTKEMTEWEQTRLEFFKQFAWAKLRMDQIKPAHLGEWRDERLKLVKGSTINRDFHLISHVFSVARDEWKWIDHNPMTGVRRPSDEDARRRRVSDREVQMVYQSAGRDLNTVTGRVALAFEFGIETGMRGIEMVRLTPAMMFGAWVRLPKTKNGDMRDVPLSPRAQEIVAQVPEGFGFTSSQKDALFRKAVKKTGIVDLHFHDSRAEAVWRLSKVYDVLELAQIIGHRDINELRSYYRTTAEELAVKMAKARAAPAPTLELPTVQSVGTSPPREP